MPSYITSTTVITATANNTTRNSESKDMLESSYEHHNGTGKNCLICGSIVHMTRVSTCYNVDNY
jgi:hypothetical protein